MTTAKPQLLPLYVNPYVFQPADCEWRERRPDGTYVYQPDIIIRLGIKPRTQPGRTNPGCVGDNWVLDEHGDLLLMRGYTANGPNVLADAQCRMLAADVHDALCSDEAAGAYGYFQTHAIFARICNAQGDWIDIGRLRIKFGWLWFVFLCFGNWINTIINKHKSKRKAAP